MPTTAMYKPDWMTSIFNNNDTESAYRSSINVLRREDGVTSRNGRQCCVVTIDRPARCRREANMSASSGLTKRQHTTSDYIWLIYMHVDYQI